MAGETEEALFQICSVTENTLRREGYEPNAKGYKAWLLDNTPIITGVSFGCALAEMSFGGSPDQSVKPVPLQHLLYKLVRCGLYHQGQMESDITFTENTLVGGPPHGVPKSFVIGLIFAVVASPCNSGGQTKPGFFFSSGVEKLRPQDWWGRRDELLSKLRSLGV